ncbi:MAG: LmeA family phospholipid-binding protein [Methanoregulaceae archaeon]|nr:LmeA family phospholipid-binding protein [Methanoregulaceae archaeon]
MADSANVSVGTLSATLKRVRLPMGLLVQEVVIDAADATVSSEPLNVTLADWGTITATVAADDLAAFLNNEAPGGLRDFAVVIESGSVKVSATAKVIVELRATAVCTLVIREGKQLFVQLDEVEGLAMAKGMIQGQLEQINPVLDVGDLPFDIVLEKVVAQSQAITLHGRARPRPAG